MPFCEHRLNISTQRSAHSGPFSFLASCATVCHTTCFFKTDADNESPEKGGAMPKWFQYTLVGAVLGASAALFSFAVGYTLYKSVRRR